MFNKYQSHSLTELSKKLAELFKAERLNPMKPAWVVVQNNEVKEWLSLQIAKENGITGNIRFIFPSEFIWMIYRLKHNHVPKALPSDMNALHWTLFELLGRDSSLCKDIPFISESDITATKRFQLASQIADVLDQYQVYRPEMIYKWRQRKFDTKHADEQWQLKLWLSLEDYWSENPATKGIPSRAIAHNQVIEWLNNGDEELLKAIPEEVYVFGLSHLNKPFMEVIAGISDHKNVHFFYRLIELSSDNDEANALFDSWQRPYVSQLKLLGELVTNSQSKFMGDGEQSQELPEIELHSCHGTRREIEVLKDEILRYLDEHPDADASDVLILLPDAEEYAPLIETHFNSSGSTNTIKLPVSRLYKNKTQLLEHSLVSLLELLNSSFKPSKVVDVLSLQPVKARFNITDNDIDQLEEWILSNRIYRGLGSSYNDAFTWQKGVNQLIAGAVIEPDYLESYKGLVPLVEVTSSEQMALMAKFSLFIHTLKDVAKEVEGNKTPKLWLNLVENICKKLIFDVEKENEEAAIFNHLTRLKEQIAFSIGNEAVSFTMFRSWFKGQIETTNSSSGRFGQGITVSTYIPYRSVPFRFIAILGLNEGIFPRRVVRPEFDLIYKDPQVGDRIQNEDDSFLFFEVLSSACDRLHLSYKGQDLRSETDRLPSMLVQQLKECIPTNISVVKHRLHHFSKSYFLDNPDDGSPKPLLSYDHRQLKVAEKVMSDDKTYRDFKLSEIPSPDVFQEEDLSLSDLISFVCDPTNYILHNVLGISFNVYRNDIQDRELFDLNGLDKYRVDILLYDSLKKDITSDKVYNYAYTSGYLPDMLKGKKVFEEECNKTELLLKQIDDLTKQDESAKEVRLNLSGVNIYGKVCGLFGNTLVLHRAGQRREKHEIEQWILHNALIANGFPVERSFFISLNKSGSVDINQINTDTIDSNVIEEVLKWYTSDKPIIDKVNFFPKTSKAYASLFLKDQDEEKAIRKARQIYTPGRFNKFAEGGDESNKLVWMNEEPFSRDSFTKNAMNFWGPYLQAVEGSNE